MTRVGKRRPGSTPGLTLSDYACASRTETLFTRRRTPRPPAGAPPRGGPRSGTRTHRSALLQSSPRDPADERVHEQVVDDRHGDGDDERSRHEGSPEEHIAADEIGDHTERDHFLVG